MEKAIFRPLYCRATLCVSAVFTVARYPSCLSVTFVHSLQTAENIGKLLCRPGSPISLVFDPRRRYPIPRGTPSAGAQKKWWEKFAIFDWNRRLYRKRYEIDPWLLWNVNRKSHALYRMVTFSMTLTNPWPGFQGHGIFEVEYLKNLGTKVL